MQSSKVQKGEIRKPSSGNNAKQIEKDNRIGKTRDLFKKITDTKGIFHAKIVIKNRKGTDLTEAEDIKERWQEYTEELYKKDLNDPDKHNGVITHLEQTPWSVKSNGPWEASLRTKMVEGIEFQVSYFKS